MSAPPYMKLYVADYLGDTHHLSALEHGAYLLLLMAMWRAGGRLPVADANLAKLARCTPDQWAEIKPVVIPFFTHSRGRLTHKRLAQELAKYENTSGKRSEAGKRGGRQKASENNAPGEANAKQTESNSRHNQNQNHKDILGATSSPNETARSERADDGAKRGSRLPATWIPSAEHLAFAESAGFDTAQAQQMADNFRDYWTAASGRNAVKLDWSATWRTWVRNQRDRGTRLRPAPSRQVDWC